MICTVQVSNNRQLNTLITVHRGIERDQKKERKEKKKKFIYCAHGQRYYYKEIFTEYRKFV